MDLTLGRVVKSALLAGVFAALTAGLYNLLVTEPVLQRAIDFESMAANGDGSGHELVSRDVQHIGLFVGFILYGLTWALLTSVAYFALQAWRPVTRSGVRALLLAGLMYWSVVLLPFLKYPPNPPGVGETESLGDRQVVYFAFLALAVLGSVLAVWASSWASERGWISQLLPARLSATGSALALVAALLVIVMPGHQTAGLLPDELVNSFRWRSVLGLTLFWGLFATGFAALLVRGRALPVEHPGDNTRIPLTPEPVRR